MPCMEHTRDVRAVIHVYVWLTKRPIMDIVKLSMYNVLEFLWMVGLK